MEQYLFELKTKASRKQLNKNLNEHRNSKMLAIKLLDVFALTKLLEFRIVDFSASISIEHSEQLRAVPLVKLKSEQAFVKKKDEIAPTRAVSTRAGI